MMIRTLYLFLAIFVIRSAGWSQVAPEFVNFTHSNDARDLLTTPEALWLATGGGLVRIDLATGEQTFYNRSNSDLPSNAVNALAPGLDGTVWAGTNGGLVLVLPDGSMEIFNTVNSPLPTNAIRFLETTPDGRIWISGAHDKLLSFDGQDWMVDTLPSGAGAQLIGLNWLYADRQGWLWGEGRLSSGSMFQFNGDTIIYWNETTSNLPEDLDVDAVAMDTAGRLWISDSHAAQLWQFDGTEWQGASLQHVGNAFVHTPSGGLLLTKFVSDRFFELNAAGQWVTSNFDFDDDFAEMDIKRAVVDSAWRFWMATNRALHHWQPGEPESTFLHCSNSALPTNGIAHLAVRAGQEIWLTAPPETNFSLGEANGGPLLKFVDGTWTQVSGSSGAPSQLSDLKIDQQDNVWIASSPFVYRYNGIGWTSDTVPGFPYNVVSAIGVAPDGEIWVGGFAKIARLTAAGYELFDVPNGDPALGMEFLEIDAQYHVWTAMDEFPSGVAEFDGADWTVHTATDMGFDYDGAAIQDLTVSPAGEVWVATDLGLARHDEQGWTTWTYENTGLLIFHDIDAIAFDGDVGWFGYRNLCCPGDMGLTKFEDGVWSSIPFSTSDLPGTQISALAVDAQHNLWIGTPNRGLAVYQAGGVALDTGEPGRFPTAPAFDIRLSPNPAANFIHWEIECEIALTGSLSVVNACGQVQKNIPKMRLQPGINRMGMPVRDWPAGYYSWRFQTEKGVETGRFLVLH